MITVYFHPCIAYIFKEQGISYIFRNELYVIETYHIYKLYAVYKILFECRTPFIIYNDCYYYEYRFGEECNITADRLMRIEEMAYSVEERANINYYSVMSSV